MILSRSRKQLVSIVTITDLIGFWSFMPIKTAIIKALDFTPVEAKVVDKQMMCRVFGKTPEAQAYVDKNPQWARGTWSSCGDAEAYLASGETRYHKMALIDKLPQYVFTFEYVAPADGSQRIVRLHTLSIGFVGSGDEFKVGKSMKILGHKKDPEKASLL